MFAELSSTVLLFPSDIGGQSKLYLALYTTSRTASAADGVILAMLLTRFFTLFGSSCKEASGIGCDRAPVATALPCSPANRGDLDLKVTSHSYVHHCGMIAAY